MCSQLVVKRIRQVIAGAVVTVASTGLFAAATPTTVQLPGINEMTAEMYGDFYVYSLDLLQQCDAAGDPRCVSDGPYPVQSSPGQIAAGLLIYQGGASGDNYDSASGPLDPDAPAGDNPFVPPSGVTSTYQFNATDEPGPPIDAGGTNNDIAAFTGDQPGTWEVQLGALADYLGFGTDSANNLVFLFDNNQTGSGPDQWLYMWASAAILDTSGNLVGGQCYQLFSNSAGDDCTNPTNLVAPTLDPVTHLITNPLTTSYVAVVGDFCVDTVTGASYNIGLAGNAGACAIDQDTLLARSGYYISNNLGQNSAEFAAYSMLLEQFIMANYMDHPDWVLSINARFAGMNDGNEQLWIAGTAITVPEPGTLALFGIGFVGMALMLRRRRQSDSTQAYVIS